MAKVTGINWTHHTFNGVWGCTRVSEACKFCYAEQMSRGWPHHYDGQEHSLFSIKPSLWGREAPRRPPSNNYWREPHSWDKQAAAAGERRRVFAYSIGDWAEDHPTVKEQLPRLWKTIRNTPNLDWLLLTKRPERISISIPNDWGQGYLNVWLGTTIEMNKWLSRAYELAKVPAVVHFWSVEPILEEIILPDDIKGKVDWIICGGESGANRRWFDGQWARSLRDQSKKLGISFWMKQMSALKSHEAGRLVPPDLQIYQLPKLYPPLSPRSGA
jgi:protein gp37